MRKLFLSFLSILMILALGCSNIDNSTKSPKNDVNDVYLEKILEIEQSFYSEIKYNHKNTVSDDVQHTSDKNLIGNRSLDINGTPTMLKYEDTLFYPVGEKRVHRYFVDGDKNQTVLIDENGKINSLLFRYTQIDIYQNSSAEQAIELLKDELSKIFDVSFYQNVSYNNRVYEDGGFGAYDIVFYNQKDGYMTDYLRASVDNDGSVYGVRENRLKITDFEVDINKEKENAAIEAKLKDVFTTDLIEYKSWKYSSGNTTKITVYDGKLYVKYYVVAEYTHVEYGKVQSFVNKILIPLDLISN